MKFALIPFLLVLNTSDGELKSPSPNALDEAIRSVLEASEFPVKNLGFDRPHSLAEVFPMPIVKPPACIDVNFAVAPRDRSAKIPNIFSLEAAKREQLWLEEKARCKGQAFSGAAVSAPSLSKE